MGIASDLPVDELSVAEKLLLLERLWESLSRKPGDVQSPDRHAEILSARESDVRDGRSSFVDWEDAKRRLRDRRK
jgi:putative addiction module component (TIGR02574 family)